MNPCVPIHSWSGDAFEANPGQRVTNRSHLCPLTKRTQGPPQMIHGVPKHIWSGDVFEANRVHGPQVGHICVR